MQSEMNQLAPIEAYKESIALVALKRLGLAVGIAFGGLCLGGLVIAVVLLVPSNGRGQLPWSLLVGACTLSGAVFGFAFPRGLKRRLLRITEAVYAGTGPYATQPPDGAFTHSLPCSLLKGKIEVGGVLYLGRRLATFVPHSMNLPRHRQLLTIADGTGCGVQTLKRSSSLLTALVGTSPPDLVEIVSPQGTWRLNTPRPAQIASEIRILLGP